MNLHSRGSSSHTPVYPTLAVVAAWKHWHCSNSPRTPMQLPQRRSYMDMIQYSIAFCNPQGPLDNGKLLTLAVVKIHIWAHAPSQSLPSWDEPWLTETWDICLHLKKQKDSSSRLRNNDFTLIKLSPSQSIPPFSRIFCTLLCASLGLWRCGHFFGPSLALQAFYEKCRHRFCVPPVELLQQRWITAALHAAQLPKVALRFGQGLPVRPRMLRAIRPQQPCSHTPKSANCQINTETLGNMLIYKTGGFQKAQRRKMTIWSDTNSTLGPWCDLFLWWEAKVESPGSYQQVQNEYTFRHCGEQVTGGRKHIAHHQELKRCTPAGRMQLEHILSKISRSGSIVKHLGRLGKVETSRDCQIYPKIISPNPTLVT